jgi:hypothetical protein
MVRFFDYRNIFLETCFLIKLSMYNSIFIRHDLLGLFLFTIEFYDHWFAQSLVCMYLLQFKIKDYRKIIATQNIDNRYR